MSVPHCRICTVQTRRWLDRPCARKQKHCMLRLMATLRPSTACFTQPALLDTGSPGVDVGLVSMAWSTPVAVTRFGKANSDWASVAADSPGSSATLQDADCGVRDASLAHDELWEWATRLRHKESPDLPADRGWWSNDLGELHGDGFGAAAAPLSRPVRGHGSGV